jgi:heme exporter protein A
VDEFVIEIEELRRSFGRIQALKGINLKIKKGKFLTIFGPNGAGKTTLIMILSTLMRPTSGRIKIEGYDIKKDEETVRRAIGVLSHNTFLYGNLTAYENLRFYGKMFDIKNVETVIDRMLERFGLSKRKNMLVRSYSRGMQQRLSIARAIIHNPTILLLDEPYTGLDYHATNILKDLLYTLKEENRTIIMTTHDLKIGLEISDMVAIQVSGKIQYIEDIERVDKKNFENLYSNFVDNGVYV